MDVLVDSCSYVLQDTIPYTLLKHVVLRSAYSRVESFDPESCPLELAWQVDLCLTCSGEYDRRTRHFLGARSLALAP